MHFSAFWTSKRVLFLQHLKVSVVISVAVVFAFFPLIPLFLLMESKQMAVRGLTGRGRPPVIGFY